MPRPNGASLMVVAREGFAQATMADQQSARHIVNDTGLFVLLTRIRRNGNIVGNFFEKQCMPSVIVAVSGGAEQEGEQKQQKRGVHQYRYRNKPVPRIINIPLRQDSVGFYPL